MKRHIIIPDCQVKPGQDFSYLAFAGSCYQHNESYLNHQTNEHWRGSLLLNEIVDGTFDECFVSLNYLKEKYS